MFIILLIVFVVIPAIEINVLIQVGESIGAGYTVALVFLTAIVGVSLVRSQGLHTLMTVQQKLAKGEAPGQEIVEGMMLAAAGVLLLIPGFVTDFIGLLLLTPITRQPIAGFLFKRMKLNMVNKGGFNASFGASQQGSPFNRGNPFDQNGNTFDGDFERKDDPRPSSHHIEHDVIDVEPEPTPPKTSPKSSTNEDDKK